MLREESHDEKSRSIEKLKELFPSIVNEGKVNLQELSNLLGEEQADPNERFGLSWVGKHNSIKTINTPSKGTLRWNLDKSSMNSSNHDNAIIEGDNLEVLKIIQKSYFNKVKMIYIDPPYNTGEDFIYNDNYMNSLENYLHYSNQLSEDGTLVSSNTDKSGRKHSDWLNMMYPRLFLARNMLKNDGVIFISIDENESHRLRMLLDEVFGEENFIDSIVWKKRYGGGPKEKFLVTLHETIFMYAKDKGSIEDIFVPLQDKDIKRYYRQKDQNFPLRGPYRTHPLEATKSVGKRENLIFPIEGPNNEEIWPERQWWWDKERVNEALRNGELEYVQKQDGTYTVHTKQYLRDSNGVMRKTKEKSIIDDVFTQHGVLLSRIRTH